MANLADTVQSKVELLGGGADCGVKESKRAHLPTILSAPKAFNGDKC